MAGNDQINSQDIEEEINLDDFNFDDVIDFDPAEDDFIPEPVETGSLEESMTDIDDLLNIDKKEPDDFSELISSSGDDYNDSIETSFDDLDDETEIDSEIDKYLKEPDQEIDKDELLLNDKSFLDIDVESRDKTLSVDDSYKEIDNLLENDFPTEVDSFADTTADDFSFSDTDEFMPATGEATTAKNIKEEEDELGSYIGEGLSGDFDSFSGSEETEENIALSDEELGDILGSTGDGPDEDLSVDLDFFSRQDETEEHHHIAEAEPFNISGSDEEETIALSEDELSNITGDFDEDISLSDDELGDILGSDEEEPIALSEEELSSISAEPDSVSLAADEFEDDLSVDLDSFSGLSETTEDFTLPDDLEGDILGSEEDEPIALSADELNNIGFEPEEETGLSDSELGDILGSDEEEPIALSADELNNIGFEPEEETGLSDSELGDILGSDEEEPIALSADELNNIGFEPEEETGLSDAELGDILGSEEDEPIALSADELNNIGFEPEEETGLSDAELGDILGSDEEEPIALSADELNNIGFEPEEETGLSDSELGDILGSDEDEPIALSADELNNIAAEPEEETSFSQPDLETVSADSSDADEFVYAGDESDTLDNIPEISDEKLLNLLDEEMNEPISLSTDELENLSASPFPEDEFEDSIGETDAIGSLDEISNINELDEIAPVDELSGDELEEFLGDQIPGETLESLTSMVEEEPVADKVDTSQFFGVTDIPLTINMDEYAPEGEKSLTELVRGIPAVAEKPSDEKEISIEGISKKDMKEMMGYLDTLLGSLPDDTIREFSKSNYFDLYKKMMQDIGL